MNLEQQSYYKGTAKALHMVGEEMEHSAYSSQPIDKVQYFIDGMIQKLVELRKDLPNKQGGQQ